MVTGDLFARDDVFRPLSIVDADVSYLPRITLGASADFILRQLIAETPWRSETVVVWGRAHAQPRLIAWYGDAGKTYRYSGIQLVPLPLTVLLADIKRRIEASCAAEFNSVLLNYYRDHRDSMGFHSDDEPELGDRPVIASLSLGEERTFVLKHKRRSGAHTVRLKLASGSVLLMKGETQRRWKHGIEKLRRPCGPRVNLTFRSIRTP